MGVQVLSWFLVGVLFNVLPQSYHVALWSCVLSFNIVYLYSYYKDYKIFKTLTRDDLNKIKELQQKIKDIIVGKIKK